VTTLSSVAAQFHGFDGTPDGELSFTLGGAPHPLARQAAEELMTRLRTGFIADGFGVELLNRREGGKMFGVLVVRDGEGRLGVLHGFSGQLGWDWHVPGFVPPLFDEAARTAAEAASDLTVHALTAQVDALSAGPALRNARAALEAFDTEVGARRTVLEASLASRKLERRARRDALRGAADARKQLDAQSAEDTRLRRSEEATWKQGRAPLTLALAAALEELARVKATRAAASREAMKAIFDTYHLRNARGEHQPLRALFSAGEPPWGAGDCSAPKLLGFALANRLTPLALAEFWWGPTPPGGGRTQGEYYPPCEERCGPILSWLLAC
jgi:tRNA pseudouridine32 synthase/23S rRNA pseudouridine746 synthase